MFVPPILVPDLAHDRLEYTVHIQVIGAHIDGRVNSFLVAMLAFVHGLSSLSASISSILFVRSSGSGG